MSEGAAQHQADTVPAAKPAGASVMLWDVI